MGDSASAVTNFNDTPKPYFLVDVNGNKISYNPNGQNTMANSSPVTIASNQTPVPTNVIEYYIRQGQGFLYTSPSALATAAAALNVCSLSIFNPANSGKTIYLYSLVWQGTEARSVNPGLSWRKITTDPSGTTGFTNVPTIQNLSLGSATASIASICTSPNAIAVSITPTGTLFESSPVAAGNAAIQELLSPTNLLVIPPGSGLEIVNNILTSADYFNVAAKGVEF